MLDVFEEIARSQARRDALMKTASPLNAMTIGGAILGGGYGAMRGAAQSREGESNLGAIGGGVLGAVGGAFAGGGLRALGKKVPEGWKSWQKGNEALEKEYLKTQKLKAKPTSGAEAKEFKSGFKDWRQGKLDEMREAEDLLVGNKQGKEARDAIDQVRGQAQFKNLADYKAGKEQAIGAAFGGALGLGYGGYQVLNAGSINQADEQEKALQKYVDLKEGRTKSASYEAVDRVGRLLARRGW